MNEPFTFDSPVNFRQQLGSNTAKSEYEEVKNLQLSKSPSKNDELIRKLQAEKDELTVRLKLLQSASNPPSDKADKIMLKSQLAELTETLNAKEVELAKSKHAVSEIKVTYESIVSELREEINRLNDKHKHDSYTRELEYPREISALKSNHALELAQQSEEWEQACEEKVKELEDKLVGEREGLVEKMEQLKKGYEEKIAKIRRSMIPAEEHAKGIERVKEHCEAASAEEVNRVRREFQEREIEHNKKLETVVREAKKVQESAEVTMKNKQEELEDSMQKLTKEKNEFELNLQRTKRELNKKAEEITELEETLEAVKKTVESERKKRKEAEAALKVASNALAGLEDEFAREKKGSTQMTDNLDNLRSELRRTTEENQELAYKCKSLEADMSSLHETFRKQLEERNNEIQSLKHTINDQENETMQLNKTVQERKTREDKILEEEGNKHSETKKALLKEEERSKQLQLKLESMQKECSKIIKQRTMLESKLSEATLNIANLERQLERSKSDLEELAEMHNKMTDAFEELKQRLRKVAGKRAAELMRCKDDIKKHIKEMSANLQEYHNSFVANIGSYYKQVLKKKDKEYKSEFNRSKAEFDEIIAKRMEEQAIECDQKIAEFAAKCENDIKQKELKVNHSQLLIDELEAKSQVMNGNITELEKKLQKTLAENREWKQLNDQLHQKLKENAENFSLYKRDTEKYLNESLIKVRRKNESEFTVLTKEKSAVSAKACAQIEGMKEEFMGELKKILADIALLKVQYQTEINFLQRSYEEKLFRQGQVLLTEKELNKKYSRNTEQLSTEIELARNTKRELQMDSDEKLRLLNKTSAGVAERYNKLKGDSMKTIEALQTEIRCLRAELTGKNEELKESQESCEQLKQSLLLERSFSKSQLSGPQKDYTQTAEYSRLREQRGDALLSKRSRYSLKKPYIQ
eukprot:TRINITY_DN2757_c0_g4_i2.p1 TRINITY_DN2757_c0_g4~~TRINITY_DN2757_c0_g4_i2.p1  ORF type:complete len:930 (+),score=284.85 TRINITY_DN2757_c0_g4_i2:161-2950(+)